MRRRIGHAVLALALVALAPVAGQAEAHHGGRPIGSFSTCDRPVTPPRCSSVGDNAVHHVFFDASLTDGLAEALRTTMADDYGPTKLTMIVDDEIDRRTDVIAFSEDYGQNGAAGWVSCPPNEAQGMNASGHRWCRGQELFFNLNPRYAIFFDDADSRHHVACHELGHTLGLRHWGNPPESAGPAAATCMNANTPNGPTTLHAIDIDHINAYDYSSVDPRWKVRFSFPLIFLGGGLVDASEVEAAGSLAEMTASADAVVVARVASVAPGRVFGTSRPLHYAAVTLDVGSVLAGTAAGHLTLEVPLFDGPSSIDELSAAVGMEAIFFLRAKTDGDFYRLTNFGAVIANDGGRAAAADGPAAFDALRGAAFTDAVARILVAAAP